MAVQEQSAQLAGRLVARTGDLYAPGPPPALDGRAAVLEAQEMPARQPLDPGEVTAIHGRDHVVGDVGTEGGAVRAGLHVRVLEDRLDLGPEDDPAVRGECVVDRLLAEGVSAEGQPPGTVVPDREGEHPVQTLEGGVTPLRPRMQQNLGVPPVRNSCPRPPSVSRSSR
jgi:hypothetical protein